MLSLAAVAWVAVAVTHGPDMSAPTPGGSPIDAGHAYGHTGHGLSATTSAPATTIALVLGGWSLMVVAMMLPPALPLLQMMRQLTRRHRHRHALLAYGALAFVGVWTGVGVVLMVGNAALDTAAGLAWPDRPQIVTGAVLIAAGCYQFTPLKRSCLRACRSPRSFALAHWRGRRSAPVEAVSVSAAYAASCVGCCWALMAISLTVGAAALAAMVVLAVVMAAERLLPWGRRLVTPVGIALLLLGTLTALELLPNSSF